MLANLLDAGFDLLVTFVFGACDELLALRVAFIFWLARTFLGAVHVVGLATILPFRVPLVHLYLRTVLPPLRPNIGVAPSVTSSININLPFYLKMLFFLKLDLSS